MKNGFHFEDQPQISEFLRQLPYELTAAQLRVWDDMQKDMKKSICHVQTCSGRCWIR